ncbi:MAG: cyclic nucleotide-binding domain-containing protein [Actinomycetota bacterium]|nr:cyclic nucleotide-binding domain-containing protein [Actinomycetota bacterium]
MPRAPVEVLMNVPLFAGLEERDLQRLAERFQERTFSEGETVVREGSTGTSFFVIGEGSATVSVGDEVRDVLGPGDYFGEIALVDEGVRSASIVAATDLRCYFLTPWEFRPFVEEHPRLAWSLLQNLARRLRSAQSV